MRTLFRKNENEMGAIGIGAMIVFIAMVLVAGIAASVLISTANTVQIQAQQTGQQTTQGVASGIEVFEIMGRVNYSNSTYYDLKYLVITVKARPGSPNIDLNNTYILFSDGDTKALLRYEGNTFKDDISGDLFGALSDAEWNTSDRESFAIGVLQDFDNTMTVGNPVINRGDKAALFIRCSPDVNGTFDREIPERTDVYGRIIPEIGAPGVISFTTPMTYIQEIYKLQ
jgi:flagellin FlaB